MPNSSQDSRRDSDRVVPNDSKAELEICIFYSTVIKIRLYHTYNPTFEEILKSLPTIRNYKFGIPSDGVPFHEYINRFVYIYEYCFIHSLVMYDRFSDFLKCNPVMLNKLISMSEVRLCLLGGGAGFEAISIFKIFDILKEKSGLQSPLSLSITIIDVCSGWEKDAELIISSAQSQMCQSNIEVDFRFIEFDLTSDFSESVESVLKESHIVTMCKFLSDIDTSHSKSRIHELMERIIDSMSFGACLFLLDNGGSSVFKKADKMIDELAETSSIYKGGPYSRHILRIDSVERISEALGDIFHYLKCTSQTIASCSAWLKINHIESDSGIDAVSANISIKDMELQNKLKNKGRKIKIKKTYQSKSSAKSEEFFSVTDWRVLK